MKRSRVALISAVAALSLLAGACGRSGSDSADGGNTQTTTAASAKCSGATLQATEIGVTASNISVEVSADTGSPLAPGLFQGNVDAMNAYAKWINANGGVGCRQLKVDAWDSKLSPEESKNGLINACANDLAMVGGNSLFNPDTSVLGNCADKAGQPVGLPDFVALANDVNEVCATNVWSVQSVGETCSADGKPVTGPRDIKAFVGNAQYMASQNPGLKGVFLVPGDLPTTIQSATVTMQGQKDQGIEITAPFKVSGSMAQSALTPFIQSLKDTHGNYVYDGSTSSVMIKARKEAAAQGYDGVKVWGCSLSCYDDTFKQAGSIVDGTYVWTQFLPFEEAANNETIQNYVTAIGGKIDAFGLNAWQAGMAFTETINRIVAADGPNAITRSSVISTMKNLNDFTAGGSMGPKGPKTFSDCMVMMQIKDGKFTRVLGKPGELSCDPNYVETIKNFDPAAEAASVK